MTIKTAEQFINLIYDPVLECCKRHGWGVPSAIIAQACLESIKSSGWSGLASTCFNFWGMKWNKKYGCDYKEYKTAEQRKDGSYYTVISKFNKYPTVEAGIDGYFVFVEKNPRYKKVMECRDFVSYATEIKNASWASSLKYTQNIINKVLSLNLQRFDVMLGTLPTSEYVVGKTYTTQQDLNVRTEPNGDKKPFLALTSNAQQHAFAGSNGEGILKNGTRVTVLDVQLVGSCTWVKIPSGWICAKNSKHIYVM